MKAKDLVFKLIPDLDPKNYRNFFKNGSEKSFITYLWSKVDV